MAFSHIAAPHKSLASTNLDVADMGASPGTPKQVAIFSFTIVFGGP
ncbi:MAG: hypothetical protein WKF36_02145 [Candidatus Nitrosocosmicus sp.]